jgi:hypothetical protein
MEFLDQLRDYKLLNEDSLPWSGENFSEKKRRE